MLRAKKMVTIENLDRPDLILFGMVEVRETIDKLNPGVKIW